MIQLAVQWEGAAHLRDRLTLLCYSAIQPQLRSPNDYCSVYQQHTRRCGPVAAQQCGVVSSRAFRLGLRSRLSVPRSVSRSILPSSSFSASAVATNAFVTDIIRWRLHRLAWREDCL